MHPYVFSTSRFLNKITNPSILYLPPSYMYLQYMSKISKFTYFYCTYNLYFFPYSVEIIFVRHIVYHRYTQYSLTTPPQPYLKYFQTLRRFCRSLCSNSIYKCREDTTRLSWKTRKCSLNLNVTQKIHFFRLNTVLT